jgi:hypothetical protein
VQIEREGERRAFADADDADLLGADDGDGELGQADAQREGRQETGAAPAQDDHAPDHTSVPTFSTEASNGLRYSWPKTLRWLINS